MRRASRTGALAALLLAVAACSGETGGRRIAAVQVGEPAPAYQAVSLAGDSVSLERLRDKVVLLNIWATWCIPCRTEMPELQRLYQQYAPRGLEVVGVSIDAGGEDASVQSFAREYGMTFPLWRDPDGRVSTTFAAIGVPATYLIGRDGTLLWRKLGPIAERDPELARVLEQALGRTGS